MNWLETIFGLSPDGGNGATEMLIMLGIALALTTVLVGRARIVRTRRARPKVS